jgi:hypothetical protein
MPPLTLTIRGSIMSRGMVARSWRSSIDSAPVPSGRSSHPFSLSIGSTKVLLKSTPVVAIANATSGCSRSYTMRGSMGMLGFDTT